MADTKITLPGSETVTLTGQTIDKLIRAGDGDAALLYLYMLKTNGQSTSAEAAIALDKSKGWVATAMTILKRLKLVLLDEEEFISGMRPGDVGTRSSMSTSSNDDFNNTDSIFKEPKNFTEDEVKNEILSGSNFSVVVDETQRMLGKILSPHDLLRLFGIYENLRLPPEVILQLITHCINESLKTGDGRAPNLRYIEKAAYTWEREGIFTLDKAEEYLKALEIQKSARGEIKRVLQIKDREFSPTERKYVDGWVTMGFEPGAIAIAYDRTVVKTGNPAIAYIDGILRNWHSKGLHTAGQVTEQDGGRKQSGSNAGANINARTGSNRPDAQKHGAPNPDEMERLRRLRKKIRDD